MITQLVVSGCSFTANNHATSCSWGNFLADRMGAQCVNLARDAAGNEHIARSVILYLEQNRPAPEHTLVLVMWSGVDRLDLLASAGAAPTLDHHYQYTADTKWLGLGAESWGPNAPWIQYIKRTQNTASLALRSWLAMNSLSTYLERNNYCYRYLEYTDILHGQGISLINFVRELATQNIVIDTTPWLLTGQYEPLGEYALRHEMLIENDSHPTMEAHETWCQQLLIPALEKSLCTNIIQQT